MIHEMSVIDPHVAVLPRQNPWVVMNRLSIAEWLRAHGKFVRPELTKKQRLELKECFELIDADGSGAIDASEMLTAFHVLGIRTKRSEIEEMLAEVDGSGEVEYAEFVQIMTTKMDSQSQEQEPRTIESGKAQPLPFQLLAQAYRRKKLMEAVMGGDKGTQERLQARAEEMEAERVAAIAEAEAQKRQVKKRPKPLSQVTKERIRWKARLKKQEQDMPLGGYVLERIDQDVQDVLFGVHERAHIRRSSMSVEEKVTLEDKIAQERKNRDQERHASATKSSTTHVPKIFSTPESYKSTNASTTTPIFEFDIMSERHESITQSTTTSTMTPKRPDSASKSTMTPVELHDLQEQERAFSISILGGRQITSLDSQMQRYYKEELKNISAIRSKLRDKPTLEQQKIRLRALHSVGNYQHDGIWESQRGTPVEPVGKMSSWDSINTPWRFAHGAIPKKERSVSHARIQYTVPVKPQKTRLTEKKPEWINNIYLPRS